MIAQLRGLMAHVDATGVVLDVGGVGYRVEVPSRSLHHIPEIGSEATLFTAMLVREDDISLYGFLSRSDREAFQMLTGVSGVGPKVGLAMLGTLSAEELASAIATTDVKTLTRVPGVGPKLAQRVSLELGEKMANWSFEQRASGAADLPLRSVSGSHIEDIADALVSLGYSRADSRRAAERVASGAGPDPNVSELIVAAVNLLSNLGRR